MGDVHEDLRRMRLAELRVAHRDLDDVIERLLGIFRHLPDFTEVGLIKTHFFALFF